MWDKIGNVGKLLGGLGSVYGGMQEARMGKKLYELQKEQMRRQMEKENKTSANLESAIDSVYGPDKKKDNLLSPTLGLGV